MSYYVQRSITILVIFLSSTLLAQAPDTLWTKTIGYDVGEYFTSIEQTSDGGFILAGFTESFSVDSSAEYWLVRLNSGGDTVWAKVYPATEKYDNQQALQTADGGFAMVGDGDPWLLKTDAIGALTWEQPISSIGLTAGDVKFFGFTETADDGFIAVGGKQVDNIWKALLVKTDSLGVTEWAKAYGGEHDAIGFDVLQLDDSTFALAGQTAHATGGGISHGWLLKLSATGDSLWSVAYGDTADADFKSIDATTDGGFIMAGRANWYPSDTTSKVDMYLVKASSAGVHEWTKTFGGAEDDEAWAVIQTADTGFTMIGMGALETGGTTAGCWVIHTDADGDTIWTLLVGDPLHEVGMDLVEMAENEYLIAGAWIDWDIMVAKGWIARLGAIVVAVDDRAGIPEGYALHANYPNPFNPSTAIGFDLPEAAAVTLTVYDILGREMARLENRQMGAGYHQATWNGRANGGREVPTGIYFARLVTPDYSQSIKMVLLK